jgi:hypothetical protein
MIGVGWHPALGCGHKYRLHFVGCVVVLTQQPLVVATYERLFEGIFLIVRIMASYWQVTQCVTMVTCCDADGKHLPRAESSAGSGKCRTDLPADFVSV